MVAFKSRNEEKGGAFWLPLFACLRRSVVESLLVAATASSLLGCWRPGGLGVGGHYNDARSEFVGRGGNFDNAVANLEYVVSRDPSYKDSLTLLGRAYYRKGRYRDAFQVLQRALAVNSQDEIAWIALGLTELRLSNNEKGMESLKGGLTLLSKVSKGGYKGIDFWDKNHLVQNALRRTAFLVTKGLEEKQDIIQSGERLLATIDNEEWHGKMEQEENRRLNY